jgi:hypothetical protein
MTLDYMLSVVRDSNGDPERCDGRAMADAPYLHPKLSTVEAKQNELKTKVVVLATRSVGA